MTPDLQLNLLNNLGIDALNPMQETAQTAILDDTDTLLMAPTGSGKTLAFLLPIAQLLNADLRTVQCLILTPSRELALQIEQVWKAMGTGFKVNTCYGGHPIDTEINNLSNPPALLIGTPGRIADHLDRQSFSPDDIHTLVLDEFDKSLELGFHDQMEFIVSGLTGLRKRVLVSATAGVAIPGFVRLNKPQTLDFTEDSEQPANLTMRVVYASEDDQPDTLVRLLCSFGNDATNSGGANPGGASPGGALIFANLRHTAEYVSALLNERGLSATTYHGGMEQPDRERALIRFRNGSVSYLVTTDLAARGLDIPDMPHVIHYQLPRHEHEFIHRNGRTARMHATGTAYVMLTRNQPRPEYLPADMDEEILPSDRTYSLPAPPDFVTLYISGGRKNKLSKGDIAGFCMQKGQLDKADLGRIDVQDFMSFVAVKRGRVEPLLARIRDEKMKGKKYKIEVAR